MSVPGSRTLAKPGALQGAALHVLRNAAGLVCLAVCAYVAANHPLGSTLPVLAFLGYVGVLAIAPNAWLVLVPALLPVAGLAPWSGWLYLDEFDLALLASLGMLLMRMPVTDIAWPVGTTSIGLLERVARLLLVLLAISYGIASIRGLLPLPPLDANAFANYESHYNAPRILKGFAAAILFWPFIASRLRDNPSATLRLIGVGLASGLMLACMGGLWERLAFPGLSDLAFDYRITSLFWEMHTGGAALDGYLTLTAPFAVWALSNSRRPWQHGAAAALLALTAYVVLVTFTRTTYVAVGGGLLLLLVLQWRIRERAQSKRWKPSSALIALVVIIASPIILAAVFASSGYRGLAAVAGLWLMTFVAAPYLRDTRPRELLKSAISVVSLVPLLGFVVVAVPKGPYWAYGAAFSAAFLISVAVWRGFPMRWAMTASYAVLVLTVLPVATHWGGRGAAPAALLATVSAMGAVIWNVKARRPLWVLDLATLTSVCTLGIIFCTFAVATGSFFVSVRFGQTTGDLSGRINHWHESLSSLQTERDWAIGKGLGRYPDAYFWGTGTNERSGTHRFSESGGNTYLQLSGPRFSVGFGDPYRFSQRVTLPPTGPLVAILDIRADKATKLILEVCEKHLLYGGPCRTALKLSVAPTSGEWKQVVIPLPGEFAKHPWYATRLKFFVIANTGLRTLIDIDNVRLLPADGVNRLTNGDFENGMRNWFFTSDHHHLPWHIKNMWLNFLFEQGIVGMALFTGVLALALFRVTLGKAKGHPFAPYLAGSLFGFCIAGMFDTLVDVTRIAFLFYILTFLALLLPESQRVSDAEPMTSAQS